MTSSPLTNAALTDASVAHDRAGCLAAQSRLDNFLADHLAAGTLVVSAPSRLPGWSVGHVLTHLARNADANRGMLEAAEMGLQRVMYPSVRYRELDISAGASRRPEVIVDDVATSARLLHQTWSDVTEVAWNGAGIAAVGRLEMITSPWRRWREIEVHQVDLGMGFGPENWSADYVAADLPRRLESWLAEGNELPSQIGELDPVRQLAWLFGRDIGPGFPAAPRM